MAESEREHEGDGVQADECGGAAYIAIRKHISKLSKVFLSENVATALLEEDLITESTLDEIVALSARSGQEKEFGGTKVVRKVQDMVQIKPRLFNSLCQVLERNAHQELSNFLQGIRDC